MSQSLSVTFCGGARSVTGSNFLVQGEKLNMLVDCGMFQGEKVSEDKNNEPFSYDPGSINALFVTHAHLDHVGRIPQLVHEGFHGPIYSTPPTKDIAALILEDSLDVLIKEAKYSGSKVPYGKEDIEHAMREWRTVEYHEQIDMGEHIKVSFKDAGHILGSGMVVFERGGKELIFTGDLGNSPAPLLHNTEAVGGATYLVTESVYGNRNHEHIGKRNAMFEDVIEDTIRRGGALMIPTFSIERTQDLLFELNNLVEHGRIPEVPVYLDSPLAIRVTDVYRKYERFFNGTARGIIKSGDAIFNFPRLKRTLKTEDSIEINKTPNPKIILAGSGMSNGGRITYHEKHYLSDPKSTLLIVGYQAPGTMGRLLADGAKKVMIHGDTVEVRARIAKIQSYSAHKDADALLEFVGTGADSLKEVFVVLGEPESSLFLAQRIRDYLGIKATVPKQDETVMLEM